MEQNQCQNWFSWTVWSVKNSLFAWSFHGLFSWSFFHGLFARSFFIVFSRGSLSHGLFSWSFLIVFSHGLFSWSFSHGLCCLFMVSLAWSLATPIRQGRPFITFTIETMKKKTV